MKDKAVILFFGIESQRNGDKRKVTVESEGIFTFAPSYGIQLIRRVRPSR